MHVFLDILIWSAVRLRPLLPIGSNSGLVLVASQGACASGSGANHEPAEITSGVAVCHAEDFYKNSARLLPHMPSFFRAPLRPGQASAATNCATKATKSAVEATDGAADATDGVTEAANGAEATDSVAEATDSAAKSTSVDNVGAAHALSPIIAPLAALAAVQPRMSRSSSSSPQSPAAEAPAPAAPPETPSPRPSLLPPVPLTTHKTRPSISDTSVHPSKVVPHAAESVEARPVVVKDAPLRKIYASFLRKQRDAIDDRLVHLWTDLHEASADEVRFIICAHMMRTRHAFSWRRTCKACSRCTVMYF